MLLKGVTDAVVEPFVGRLGFEPIQRVVFDFDRWHQTIRIEAVAT